MKRLTTLLGLFLVGAMFPFSVEAAEDRPITMKELPQVAHQFLTMHFPDTRIISLMQDDDTFDRDYSVVLENGAEIEFNRSGKWEEVCCCSGSGVPDPIIPRQILEFVRKNYPSNRIVKITRERNGYEAELESGCELEFDTRLRFRKAER